MSNNYSSNISRCVDNENYRIFDLKNHDCHILMQHLLRIDTKCFTWPCNCNVGRGLLISQRVVL